MDRGLELPADARAQVVLEAQKLPSHMESWQLLVEEGSNSSLKQSLGVAAADSHAREASRQRRAAVLHQLEQQCQREESAAGKLLAWHPCKSVEESLVPVLALLPGTSAFCHCT